MVLEGYYVFALFEHIVDFLDTHYVYSYHFISLIFSISEVLTSCTEACWLVGETDFTDLTGKMCSS